jgi:glycosyltransferase involved in cell wall biosynthesis
MISVVVRTKNEEAWLPRCLSAVSRQAGCTHEIIVVDNESSDRSLEIAHRYGCRIVPLTNQEFTFGRSLNVGIRAAHGDFVAMISGHCIPLHDQWLATLRAAFDHADVAGVYGRQEPLPDTDPLDKRDLWTTFGVERRRQRRDYFFHNANAMIRRSIWQVEPFDEQIAGVEDRAWARRILARGLQIVYEPLASVYHYHGIHHGRDQKRAERVARVIEIINGRGGAA